MPHQHVRWLSPVEAGLPGRDRPLRPGGGADHESVTPALRRTAVDLRVTAAMSGTEGVTAQSVTQVDLAGGSHAFSPPRRTSAPVVLPARLPVKRKPPAVRLGCRACPAPERAEERVRVAEAEQERDLGGVKLWIAEIAKGQLMADRIDERVVRG